MKNIIITAAIIIGLTACNSRTAANEEGAEKDSPASGIQKYRPQAPVNQEDLALSENDTISLHLFMDSTGHHDTVHISVLKPGEITGMLSSMDRNANIRFTQIGLPDGTFDGPFGRELHYKTTQIGKYRIIIGQNMMAGDPWKGRYNLKLWLKEI